MVSARRDLQSRRESEARCHHNEVGGAVERVVGQQGVVGQHEAVGQQEVVLGQGLEPRRQEVVALVVLFSRTTTRCLFAHSLEQSDPHWSS
jgi:hypothetical protein